MVVCPFHHERGRREDRVPASTRGPLCDTSRTKCTEGITTGVAEDIPAFPAQWFDGLCRALPGDEFVLPPSLRELVAKLEPGWATFASAKLDTSNGCQDHTVLPYAANAARPARINRSQPEGRPAILLARNAVASTAARGAGGGLARSAVSCA